MKAKSGKKKIDVDERWEHDTYKKICDSISKDGLTVKEALKKYRTPMKRFWEMYASDKDKVDSLGNRIHLDLQQIAAEFFGVPESDSTKKEK